MLACYPQALVVRTSAFFSAWDTHNFVHHALVAVRGGQPFAAAHDVAITPTYVPDLVNMALDLLLDGEHGIWHLTNQGTYTWAQLAHLAVSTAGLDVAGVVFQPAAAFNWAAPRPRHSALRSQQGLLLPSVESGLQRYLADEALLQTTLAPSLLSELLVQK